MTPPALTLSAEALHRLFPFHLAFGPDLRLLHVGQSLQRIRPQLTRRAVLSDHFELERPRIPLTAQALRQHARSLVVLRAKDHPVALRGQVLDEGDVLLFVGSPWVTELQALDDLGLSLDDFAIHDPVVDYLALLQTQHTALEESRRLAQQLAHAADEQQRLVQAEQALARDLNAIPDVILRLDRSGTLLELKPAPDVELPAPPSELVGTNAYLALPHIASSLATAVDAALQTGTVQSVDYVHENTATTTHYEARVAPAAPDQVVVLVRNVTQRKQLEQRLADQAEQLHQAEKMAALGQLAAGVAHDFNNLLTIILGSIQMAERRIPAQARTQHLLRQATRAATRAGELTDQLLTFSQRQFLHVERLDITELLSSMLPMLEPLLEHHIRLKWSTAANLASVNADGSRIEQVMINLIVNARDAMPNGGTVRIAADNVETHNGGCPPRGCYVALTVSDDGHGIDGPTQTRIFEPFFTTKPAGRGTGLGLATVKGIVEQTGGHITVASKPGQGSVFTVYLPTATPTEEVAAMRQEVHPAHNERSIRGVEREPPPPPHLRTPALR